MSDPADVRTTHRGRLLRVEVMTFGTDGGDSTIREVVRHPGASMIVPLLRPETVVMIRNDRVAVGERLLEFPAGTLEPGEDPREAAARELREETGYGAGRLDALGSFYTSPGFSDELIRAFLASDLSPGDQCLEPGESIDVEIVPLDAAESMVRDGVIRDGKTIAALTLLRLHRRGRPT